jgi:L-malate glycosyltransferase
MFKTPDGKIWTNSVYEYDFFKRYLDVFENVRLVTRVKNITFEDMGNRVLVSGPNLEFFPLPFYHGPWQYAKLFLKIRNSLKFAIETCDFAILRIPDELSFQLFKIIKKSKIPCAVEVVAHSWDLYAPGTIKTILRPFLRFHWDDNQKKICKTADGVSYVTEKYIQKRYPSNIDVKDKSRFETFYTSANLNDNFFTGPRRKSSFDKNIFNIVHIAGINNFSKGHYELLKALSVLIKYGFEHKLIFVGGGRLLEHFINISNEFGLNKQVTFLGHLSSYKEIIEVLNRSDIFVLPTMTEGLPRVIIEAMATGLPCIANNVGGVSELLSDRALSIPKDLDSLINKILLFTNDRDLLYEESLKNYIKALEYSNKEIAIKRKHFYNKLRSVR